MPRSDRQAPNVYFGRPGALVTLPWPVGEIARPYERSTFDFLTGSGQHSVSALAVGSRPYTIRWNALHVETYARIEQYWTGMMGIGPWALVDPATPNMLRPNQSSATSTYNDARHWEINSGLLSSNATALNWIHRAGAPRSLKWSFPTAAASFPVLGATPPYRSWFGFPAVPTLPYAWSAWVRPDGVTDSAMTIAAKMQWIGPTGSSLGEVSGGDIAITGWTRLSAMGSAPAGTAYVKPILVATGSTITTGSAIYVDEPLLEQDSVLNDWAPGTGTRPVEILSFDDTVPVFTRMRRELTLSLRELAA